MKTCVRTKKNLFLGGILGVALLFAFLAGACEDQPKLSDNANLQNLSVSIGTLDPVFNPVTLEYTVNVINSVQSVTVTADKEHKGASITSNKQGFPDIQLNVGNNVITITVTAEDGATRKTYTITVNRAGALTGTVSITGTAAVGQTLTANTGSLGGSGTVSYQWKRETTDVGTNSNTYVVQSADVGSAITVTVTRSGNSGSVTSAATAVVTNPWTPPTSHTLLVADQWADGNLPNANSVDWYSITVTAGTTYRIWWNDSYEGPTTKNKTGDIVVGAWYANGTIIFGGTDATIDSGYNTAQLFTPAANGTVYVKVMPYNASSNYTGTYGIVYSTNSARPGTGTAVTFISVTANGSSSAATTQLTLTFSQTITGLTAGDITLSGVSNVSKGTLSSSGSTYTLPVSGFTAGGTLSVAVDKSGYTISGSPKTVTIYYYAYTVTYNEMIWVPGGSFQMGNPDSSVGYSDERPVHTVTLTGFYIGKYEVTQKQYQAVMGSLPSSLPSSGYGVGDNYPVYYVGWYDALVFCNKLSISEGLTPAYRISNSTNPDDWGSVPTSWNSTWNAVTIVSGSTGYRLPTEAQWEYAAKGGNGSPGNYTYAGSNNPGDVAWYSSNSGSGTHTVGTKAPNGLGLYDMSGNVWEWCWDWYGDYSSGTQTDPTGASSGSYRVGRGGHWGNSAENVRSAYRFFDNPSSRSSDFGFRLARP